MKIIFLDIDGVLCTKRAHIAQRRFKTEWHMTAFDREAVGLLNAIHEHDPENTRYVLSSTWRTHYDQIFMENHLRSFGWTGVFHSDWKTVNLLRDPSAHQSFRGNEVKEWLDRNEHITYVIFDDGTDFLESQQENFINTRHDYGISYHDYINAMLILHGVRV